MKEKIKKYWWVIIIVLIVGGAFYWFQWRPTQIRKECYNSAVKNSFNVFNNMTELEKRSELNFEYGNCLKMNGLEK